MLSSCRRTPRVARRTRVRSCVPGTVLALLLVLGASAPFESLARGIGVGILLAQEPTSNLGGADSREENHDDGEKAGAHREALRSAQESAGDPPASEVALTGVRELLDSVDPADWVRGLFQLEQALSDGKISADAWNTLLIEYLNEHGTENPIRTRAILKDRVLRTPTGERVLLELLGGDEVYSVFRRDLEETISRIATNRERRDALTERLENMTGRLFERLFPLLAHHEPGRLVGRAVELYQGSPSKSLADGIISALQNFLGQQFVPESTLIEWWGEHEKDAILELLIEQQRINANARTTQLWVRANNLIAEGDPAKHRSWLLDSLAVTETAEVRRRALQEIERFVARISSGDGAQTPETQAEFLRPILTRLPQIISGEATTTLDRDPLGTRIQAVRALRSLTIFREDKDVVAILELLIGNLSEKGFVGESPDTRVGLAAIKVAGALKSPVGDTLDRALDKLLRPGVGSASGSEVPVDWLKVPTKPLDALLDALQQVGVRVDTMKLLLEVYLNLPNAQEDVLNVLVLRMSDVPDECSQSALALFETVLEGQTTNTDPNPNLTQQAITGLGRLGLPAGIPILEKGIREAEIKGEMRSSALQSIRTIGGLAAVDSMIALTASAPEGDPLRDELMHLASELCASDPTLEYLERFLIDPETGTARAWFARVVGLSELSTVLDPGKQPADFQETRPEAFQRFERLHAIHWTSRLEFALAGADLAKIEEELAKVSSEIAPLADLLRSSPQADVPIERQILDAVTLTAGHRGRLAGQLSRNELEKLLTHLEQALGAETALFPQGKPVGVPYVGDQVSWVIAQILKFSPLQDEPAFLAGLERLSERYPMGEEVRSQLAELEARASGAEGGSGSSGNGNGGTPPDEGGGR